mmetsp:Transcript_81978/g.265586  ORF Transcript_81978/g.265586 Transcript_81978/m.265586 type:complete len:108 (+) Transcript_81978:586-909(+)
MARSLVVADVHVDSEPKLAVALAWSSGSTVKIKENQPLQVGPFAKLTMRGDMTRICTYSWGTSTCSCLIDLACRLDREESFLRHVSRDRPFESTLAIHALRDQLDTR